MSFLTFTVLILFPSHEGVVGEWMGGTELLDGVKSQEPMDGAVSTLDSWLGLIFPLKANCLWEIISMSGSNLSLSCHCHFPC